MDDEEYDAFLDETVIEQEDIVITEYEESEQQETSDHDEQIERARFMEVRQKLVGPSFTYVGAYIREMKEKIIERDMIKDPSQVDFLQIDKYQLGLSAPYRFLFHHAVFEKFLCTLQLPDMHMKEWTELHKAGFKTIAMLDEIPTSTDGFFKNPFAEWLQKFVGQLRYDLPVWDWTKEMSVLEAELQQLEQHPNKFKSAESQENFWIRLCNDSESSRELAELASELFWTETAWEVGVKRQHKKQFHTWEERRLPWQQYLHNRKPLINSNVRSQLNVRSFQILPRPGLDLFAKYMNEHRKFVRKVEAHRSFPPSAPLRVPPFAVLKDGSVRTFHISNNQGRRAAGEAASFSSQVDPTSLETLNEAYSKFDGLGEYRNGGQRNFQCLLALETAPRR